MEAVAPVPCSVSATTITGAVANTRITISSFVIIFRIRASFPEKHFPVSPLWADPPRICPSDLLRLSALRRATNKVIDDTGGLQRRKSTSGLTCRSYLLGTERLGTNQKS